ncbi:MAG TPA: F0F1 ATP synthase subunit B [Nevskiaceae bacterium]|nr:F0F1 ATP synthase subunit B [Nevskiaceae bacterium]
MQASIPSIVGQMIVFAIFVWFTMKFVWPPILKALEERRAKIADGLAAAEKGQASLKEASKSADEALKQARQQAQEILSAANKQATQLVDAAKVQAEEQKARIVESGHAEVARELASAREALRKQVADLAVMGAARILKREVDAKAHAEVLNDLAARI